jgi:hypothetical protein
MHDDVVEVIVHTQSLIKLAFAISLRDMAQTMSEAMSRDDRNHKVCESRVASTMSSCVIARPRLRMCSPRCLPGHVEPHHRHHHHHHHHLLVLPRRLVVLQLHL